MPYKTPKFSTAPSFFFLLLLLSPSWISPRNPNSCPSTIQNKSVLSSSHFPTYVIKLSKACSHPFKKTTLFNSQFWLFLKAHLLLCKLFKCFFSIFFDIMYSLFEYECRTSFKAMAYSILSLNTVIHH